MTTSEDHKIRNLVVEVWIDDDGVEQNSVEAYNWEPGYPELVITLNREKGETYAAIIPNPTYTWTADDILKAVGGLFASLSEQVKFGKGI